MSLLKQKLQSSRGATMIYALIVLLIISVISFLVLGSATVNAGRLQKARTAQQLYLNVSSAAGLVQKALDEEEITVERKIISHYFEDDIYGIPSGGVEESLRGFNRKCTDTGENENPFAPLLMDWIEKTVTDDFTVALLKNGAEVPTAEFLLTGTVDENLSYVKVTLKMELPESDESQLPQNGMNLYVTLAAVADGTTESIAQPQEEYAMHMTLDAQIFAESMTTLEMDPESPDRYDEIVTHIVKVSWTAGNIEKGV